VTRVVDFDAWQGQRRAMLSLQTEILARRTHRSHRPRTDDERQAIIDGVQALWTERIASDRWTWVGPRTLVITEPPVSAAQHATTGSTARRPTSASATP
jgi:hypothetical protein